MNDKLVFEINIEILGRIDVVSEIGKVVMIPFTGNITSELFNGVIRPGALDRQIIDVNNVKHMSARYLLEGLDQDGNPCKLYVENEGHFDADTPHPFKTIPTFYTDSALLAPYLHTRRFRGEGMRDESGLKIRIYEI